MPKAGPKLTINLNLLRPQSNPEKFAVRLLKWLLSTGRYIFIFVEALVLIAFIARFKLDADIASKKEAIEEQIPYIESLKPYEILIRQTQLKISNLASAKTNSPDWSQILRKIADQTPAGVKITSIKIEEDLEKITIHISSESKTSTDLSNFLAGLKEEGTFSDVNLVNGGLEQNSLHFSIDALVKINNAKGKNL